MSHGCSGCEDCDGKDPMCEDLQAFNDRVFEEAKELFIRLMESLVKERKMADGDPNISRFEYAASRAFMAWVANTHLQAGLTSEQTMCEFAEMLQNVREETEARNAVGPKYNISN
jgi:hypothetical protein